MRKYYVGEHHPNAACSIKITFTLAELSDLFNFLLAVGAGKAGYTVKLEAALSRWEPPNEKEIEELIKLYYCPTHKEHYVHDTHLNPEGISCERQHTSKECCHAGDIQVPGSLICELRAKLLEPA